MRQQNPGMRNAGVIVATLLFLVLIATAMVAWARPTLALFALAGLLVGLLVFAAVRDPRKAGKAIWSALSASGPLLPLAVIALLFLFFFDWKPDRYPAAPALRQTFISVPYEVSATFVPEASMWTVEETIQFDGTEAGFKELLEHAPQPSSENGSIPQLVQALGDACVAKGWTASLEWPKPRFSRSRGFPFEVGVFCRGAIWEFELLYDQFKLSESLGRVILLPSRESTVALVGPVGAIRETFPGSPPPENLLRDDQEMRRLSVENSIRRFSSVRAKLVGAAWRSPPGSLIFNLSLGSTTQWAILLVFAVLSDEIKKRVAAVLKRLTRLVRRKPAQSPEPPGQPNQGGSSSDDRAGPT